MGHRGVIARDPLVYLLCLNLFRLTSLRLHLQAEQLVDARKAVFVDVRPPHEYEQQHLPGES